MLEYADVVWDNCTQYEANGLEKIQIEATRIATGSTKMVSINALNTETGWETLESRRYQNKLNLFYKMKSGMSPHYLTILIPPIVGNTLPITCIITLPITCIMLMILEWCMLTQNFPIILFFLLLFASGTNYMKILDSQEI